MEVTCSVVRDLLPLCLEQIASDDSCHLIEEHLEKCAACQNVRETMGKDIPAPVNAGAFPLQKIRQTMRRKKLQIITLTLMLSLALGVLAMAYLTAPEHIPAPDNSISSIITADEYVLIRFQDNVSGYRISRHPADDGSGYVFHISTWDSIWHRNVSETRLSSTILNPEGDPVTALYYSPANGSDSILIYGKNLYPNGGIRDLPRLVLNYYALFAAFMVALGAVTLFLFRKNRAIVRWTLHLVFIPISYLLAQWLIMGPTAASYEATRDLYAILLVAFALYMAFLTAFSLIREHQEF
jgi:hypothetical protein